MTTIKTTIAKVTNNPIGTLIGASAGFMVAKKVVKLEKWYYLIGAVLLGALAGAMVQNKMKAKASVPTATDVKK